MIPVKDCSGELGRPFLSFALGTSAAFNAALRRIILEEEPRLVGELEHSPVASIVRGTTSTWKHHNVLTWDHPECRELKQLIAACEQRFVEALGEAASGAFVQCWCNVLRRGERLDFHEHGGAHIHTGVYYVDDVNADDGGMTYYETSPDSEEWLEVVPRRGTLSIFRGDIGHFVSEYRGEPPRVSIAFDIVDHRAPGHLFTGLFEASERS